MARTRSSTHGRETSKPPLLSSPPYRRRRLVKLGDKVLNPTPISMVPSSDIVISRSGPTPCSDSEPISSPPEELFDDFLSPNPLTESSNPGHAATSSEPSIPLLVQECPASSVPPPSPPVPISAPDDIVESMAHITSDTAFEDLLNLQGVSLPELGIKTGKKKVPGTDTDADCVLKDPPEEEVATAPRKRKMDSGVKSFVSKSKKATLDASTQRPRTRASFSKSKKSVAKKPASSTFRYTRSSAISEKFFSAQNKENWKVMTSRELLGERLLNMSAFKKSGIITLLKDQNLLETVLKPKPFISGVAYEFYSNLSQNFSIESTPEFLKVYVRGHVFDFNAQLINDFFGRKVDAAVMDSLLTDDLNLDEVAHELTGSVASWPENGNLLGTTLTTKYFLLLRIGMFNWFGTRHTATINSELACSLYRIGKGIPFDLGQLMLKRIVKEINTKVTHRVLAFPSLIYQILTRQHQLRTFGESLTPLANKLIVSVRLFQGQRIVDGEGEHVNQGSSSRLGSQTARATEFQSLNIRLNKLEVLCTTMAFQLSEIHAAMHPAS